MVEKPLSGLSDNVSTTCPWSIELTFAGLDALKPFVTSVSVVGTTAILIPGTAGSATTGSAGFLEHTALRTRYFTFTDGSDGWGARADWWDDWRAAY